MKKIYAGKMYVGDWGENFDALILADAPMAETVEADIEEHGRYLSVRYFCSPEEKTHDSLIEGLVSAVCGVGEAEYLDRYSDITGYLWTDEEFNVGGHNMISELTTHVENGRPWLWMEIEFSKVPK